MLPPPQVAQNIVSTEAPPTHPKGPNTNFQFPTPMPFRYTDPALDEHNARLKIIKKEHPIYATTTSEFGKLGIQPTDFPMRWCAPPAARWSGVWGSGGGRTLQPYRLSLADSPPSL
jgi:hypothetical protein